jgi:ABC-2 type transport system permease protein
MDQDVDAAVHPLDAAFAVVISAAAAAVFTLTTGVTERTALADMAPIDPAGASLLGADLAVIVLAILAASNVASEYTTGMLRVTLATTPRRWRPLTAKATALTGTALAGAFATLAAYGVGRLVLFAQGVPALTMGDPQLLQLLVGSTLMAPFYSLLAVALAFMVRNTGGAVALVLAIMSVGPLVNALPDWWRETLLPWMPASALHSLSGSAAPTTAGYLPAGVAALVLVVWAAVLLAAANTSLSRRDA